VEQGGQIRGVVLAVAVECDGPFATEIICLGQPGLERCAFAVISVVAQDDCSNLFGLESSFVGRAVVHDQDQLEVLMQLRYQRADGAVFVETGDNGSRINGLLERWISAKHVCS
jgi:hypothetical protein